MREGIAFKRVSARTCDIFRSCVLTSMWHLHANMHFEQEHRSGSCRKPVQNQSCVEPIKVGKQQQEAASQQICHSLRALQSANAGAQPSLAAMCAACLLHPCNWVSPDYKGP
jgi:hypothetical protein